MKDKMNYLLSASREQLGKLKKIAESEDRSLASAIRLAIAEYIERREGKQ